jgi:hypothetical protein
MAQVEPTACSLHVLSAVAALIPAELDGIAHFATQAMSASPRAATGQSLTQARYDAHDGSPLQARLSAMHALATHLPRQLLAYVSCGAGTLMSIAISDGVDEQAPAASQIHKPGTRMARS